MIPTPYECYIRTIPGEAELYLLGKLIKDIQLALHAEVRLDIALQFEPDMHYRYTISSSKLPKPKSYEDFRYAYVFLQTWRKALTGMQLHRPKYKTRPMFLPDGRIAWYSIGRCIHCNSDRPTLPIT